MFQHFEGHQRVFGDIFLPAEEYNREKRPEDNQTNHLRRVPGKRFPPKIKTQEYHQGKAYDRQTSQPINCFQPVSYPGFRVVDIQVKEEQYKCQSADRKIYPEVPSPREVFREYTTKNWSEATGNSPHKLKNAHIQTS